MSTPSEAPAPRRAPAPQPDDHRSPGTSEYALSARAGWVVVAVAVLAFGIILALVPAFFISFDEAKYLGIGAQIWAGNGPRTAFGALFLLHSPLWTATVFAPQALLGVDAVSWGHLLNAAAGMAVIGLAGVLGGWSGPAPAALAASLVLAFTYLEALSRTARLDVPAAALALLYLVIGWRAARSGSVRWSAAAGATFAAAILVKEVGIPLAPVPFLCGVLAGVQWRRVMRALGWTALFGAIGLAPWFLYYAAETGRVYRLESPAWTLGLVGLAVTAIVLVGLAANRLAASTRLIEMGSSLRSRLPAIVLRNDRALVGWGVALAWAGAWLFFFSRISRLKGASIVDPAQLAYNLRQWLVDLGPIGLVAVSGLVLALILVRVDRGSREYRGVVNNLVATICGAPLVLMVIAVGEPPRNYIAQVAIAAALAAGAWTWAIRRCVAWLRSRGHLVRLGRWVIPGIVIVGLLAGAGAATARAWLTGLSGIRGPAVETTVGWIRDNIPEGTPIAFGSFLGYEMAYWLVGDYPLYQVRHKNIISDAATPLGLSRVGERPSDDWVAVDIAPRNVNEYQAFRAEWIESSLSRHGIQYWVYATGEDTAAPAITAQLTPEHGFEAVASWDFPGPRSTITVTVYRVDLDRIALDRSRLYISAEALHRLVAHLARTPEASRAAAAALLTRVVVEPPEEAARADLDRLRELAGS